MSAAVAPERALPFWFDWVLRFGSPWWLAAAVAVVYLAIALTVFNAIGVFDGVRFDGVPFWLHPLGSSEISYALYFGWVTLAIAYLVRGTERDLTQAGPTLGLSGAELEATRRELLTVRGGALWLGTGIGVGLALLTVAIGPGTRSSAHLVWAICREVMVDAAIFSVVGWGVVVALRLSRLAGERATVRLLDDSVFGPFAHNGVRLALLWLVMWSIQAPWIFFLPLGDFIGGQMLAVLMVLFAVGAALTAIAVLLPTRGVRDRIRAAKHEELLRVRRAIEDARAEALGESPPSPELSARLPGLLAFERRIEEVSEWPFDAWVVRRLGLYLLIPVASWVGSAMVERLLDTALD